MRERFGSEFRKLSPQFWCLAEYDFGYSKRMANGVNEAERTARALSGIVGKRLNCRDSLPA